MNETPRIVVWHLHGAAYHAALRERLPDAPIGIIETEDHDTGTAADSATGTPATGVNGTERRRARALLRDAEALLAWKIPPGALLDAPGVRLIQVTGAGVDHFLERDDIAPDVLITRSLGRFGIQVAEYVVGYLLHHLLGIRTYRVRQRERAWVRGERPLLADKTVGIIGLGSLGMPTATALSGLGVRVLGVRHSGTPVDGVAEVFTAADWRAMLPACDALVIAAPKTADTTGMIDAAALAALPRGAVLINVARGAIVDETALLAALSNKHLGAAVLDVFSSEPLAPDHPLWAEPRAWITPHIAAPSEVDIIADEFAENYRRFANGEDLINLVDRTRGY